MKIDLSLLSSPLMNAAGSLGFAPDERLLAGLPPLGVFITAPVSLNARTPANGRRFATFSGGFLLHTGYPNPGLQGVLRRYARRWARASLPVVVHLLAQDPGELKRMALALENVEGVAGLEVSMPVEMDTALVATFIQAVWGELPVVARLPLERAGELAPAAARAGAAAVSFAPPRGALPVSNGGILAGRMYGPAVFPLALGALRATAGCGVPVFAGGGVYQPEQADALLAAGAQAVQLDAVLWGLRPWQAG